jgi:glycosyl transferase-like sugar-binding protein/alpha 1,4-glycosyltransferase
MATNEVIQGLWIGPCLSVMERLSIESFIANGHKYHLYVYEDVAHVPDGVVLKDGNEIVSKHEIFEDKALKAHVSFSDLFRYQLLFRKGGYWADLDIVCLKPFTFETAYVFAGERTKEGSDERKKYGSQYVNGCVMKAPAESTLMESCYQTCLNSGRPELGWEIGPPVLTDAVARFDLGQHVYPPSTFTPLNWWEWKDVVSGDLLTRLRIRWRLLHTSYAVHLWDSMWIRGHTDKTSSYDSRCLYERLKTRYLRGWRDPGMHPI